MWRQPFAFVEDRNLNLPLVEHAGSAQLNTQCIFVDPLKQAGTKGCVDLKRKADHSMRKIFHRLGKV